MSIYVSACIIADDEHAEGCARWVPEPAGSSPPFRYDPSRRCTCNAGPLAYVASHILPDGNTPRGGSLDFGEIPGFIERAGRALCCEERCERPECCDRAWPWLRVWVTDGHTESAVREGAAVLVNRDHVVRIHAYLGSWLERSEVPE